MNAEHRARSPVFQVFGMARPEIEPGLTVFIGAYHLAGCLYCTNSFLPYQFFFAATFRSFA